MIKHTPFQAVYKAVYDILNTKQSTVVYTSIPTDAAYPCITYAIVSNDSAHTLAGGAGFAARRLQIDVYAKTETSRDAVVEAVRNQLQGFPAAGTSGTIGAGTVVTSITYKNSRDVYEPDQVGGDVGYYRNIMDFWIRFQESAPSFAS